MWYGLVDTATGDLRSIGTEAMFPGGNPAALPAFDVVTLGPDRPDLGSQIWDTATRSFIPRPATVWLSRVDDVESWLMADADFMAVWNALSAARRTRLRTGVRRIVAQLLGDRATRTDSESVEI